MYRKIFIFIIFLGLSLVGNAANKKFTLVIDAGHGGHDAGAKGAFSYEKNINLNVALTFGRYVERNCPDVKVIYTRKTDIFIPLHQRADIANKNKADLFVSIHTNALPKGRISRGLETYTLGMHRASDNLDVAKRENSVILIEKDYKERYAGFDPRSSESYIMFELLQDNNMSQSVELAKFVQQKVCNTAGRQNKGVKQAGFLVLRETSMPSCLIELGFISTPDEEQYLNTSRGIDALGKGIYQAFVAYRQKYDRHFVVPYQAPDKENINIPSVVPAQDEPSVKEEKPVKEEPATVNTKIEVPQQVIEEPKPIVEEPKPIVENPKPAVEKQNTTVEEPTDMPVFKVQIIATEKKLPKGDSHFKGEKDVDYYQEGGLYKYTVGASTNYNEIYRLRKELSTNFPQAFIIAFKNGAKTDVIKAVQEFKNRKNR